MVSRIFGWVVGALLVGVFSIATFLPDLLRGYVDESVAHSKVTSGQRVYETYCVGCHGARGDGQTEAANLLLIKPRNFVSENYKFFHYGEAGPLPTDSSLTLTIRKGLPGSAMPAFPFLSEQEVTDVRTYIKTFRQGGWVERAATGVTEVGVAPPISGTTGAELFVAGGCNACHQLDVLKAAGGIGPNLSKIGSQRTVAQLSESITSPNAVIADACPAGPCPSNVMPQNFGQRFKPEQVKTLAEYMFSLK